jgi:hypothetical protein
VTQLGLKSFPSWLIYSFLEPLVQIGSFRDAFLQPRLLVKDVGARATFIFKRASFCVSTGRYGLVGLVEPECILCVGSGATFFGIGVLYKRISILRKEKTHMVAK